MQEHLSQLSLEQYRGRTLSPAELLDADDHLARCEECYARVSEGAEPGAALDAFGGGARVRVGDDHLAYEQLAAYADGGLDEVGREIADVHLEVCRECAEELRGLIDLREEPAREEEAARVPRPHAEPGGRERLRHLFAGWWPGRVAWAALALVIAGALLWLFRAQGPEPPREVADSARPSPANIAIDSADNKADGLPREAQPSPTPEGAAPKEVVALADGGGRVVLDERGEVGGLTGLSFEQRWEVRQVLSGRGLPPSPELEGLSAKAGTLMGGTDKLAEGEGPALITDEGEVLQPRRAPPKADYFALVLPVGVVVRSDRPAFKWRPVSGASAYFVDVYDMAYKRVSTSPALSSTEWAAPEPLRRGEVYLWQVTAMVNGRAIKSPARPAPDAKFKVLGKEKVDELERAARQHPNSHLLLGTLYARAGLLEEAEREFQLLLAANEKSALARRLLREVRARRAGR